VHVLDDQQQRLAPSGVGDQPRHRVVRPQHGRAARLRVIPPGVQQRRDFPRHALPRELARQLTRRLTRQLARQLAEHRQPRPEGGSQVGLVTPPHGDGGTVGGGVAPDGGDEFRLADARLTGDDRGAAVTGQQPVGRVSQDSQGRIPADQPGPRRRGSADRGRDVAPSQVRIITDQIRSAANSQGTAIGQGMDVGTGRGYGTGADRSRRPG
jgi:hypothetical protein